MTRNEAMAFAISVGKPIRHNLFSKGEFIRYNGGGVKPTSLHHGAMSDDIYG